MAIPGLPPVIKYGTRKQLDLRSGRKWYFGAVGAREWMTLKAPIDDVLIKHAGTNWITLKKKHRAKRDAVAYSKAFIKRYRRLLEALDVTT